MFVEVLGMVQDLHKKLKYLMVVPRSAESCPGAAEEQDRLPTKEGDVSQAPVEVLPGNLGPQDEPHVVTLGEEVGAPGRRAPAPQHTNAYSEARGHLQEASQPKG